MQVRYEGQAADGRRYYHVYKNDCLIGTEKADFSAWVVGGNLMKVFRVKSYDLGPVRETDGDYFRVVAALAKWGVICF